MSQEPKNVWVIADTHFGHEALVERMQIRPAGFETQIVESLTRNIKSGDLMIHLGDFCVGEDAKWAEVFSLATAGVTRVLVRGNHDSKSNSWYREHGFDFVCETFKDTYYGKRILFTHEPANLDQLESIVADFNIHGHTHGNNHRDNPRSMYHIEVACETLGYTPINIKKLLDL